MKPILYNIEIPLDCQGYRLPFFLPFSFFSLFFFSFFSASFAIGEWRAGWEQRRERLRNS